MFLLECNHGKTLIASIFLALQICLVQSGTFGDRLAQEWQDYKVQFEKRYSRAEEEQQRMQNFFDNRDIVLQHNRDPRNYTFTMTVNAYSDEELSEFNKRNGFKPQLMKPTNLTVVTMDQSDKRRPTVPPKEVDWRKEGRVLGVKNQGQCGSCWSFAATGALEGQLNHKYGKSVSLSEQNLIDCTMDMGNLGCQGGIMTIAYEYIRINKGIDTERSYPYEAADGECRFRRDSVGGTDRGSLLVPAGDEDTLKEVVASYGPVAVAIDASLRTFHQYEGGVYLDENCGNSDYSLNHAVLIVGYGTHRQHGDYWLVKNSWGTQWGDRGYVKMARNRQNHCGIASFAVLPLV